MSFYITGDTHADINIHKLYGIEYTFNKKLTEDDYVIICGDFGAIWHNDDRDYLLDDFYAKKEYTILFVDGNHDNFNALNGYDVEYWNGGKVHRIRDNVFHLMRGQVFEIDGKTIFTFGGARSVDRLYRKENISWWSQEMPSEEEYQEAFDNLAKIDFKVDYVFSHCASTSTSQKINEYFVSDELTAWFEDLERKLVYDTWFFGHYHEDKIIDDKHICLYNSIVEIENGCIKTGSLLKSSEYNTKLTNFKRLAFNGLGTKKDVQEFYEFFMEYQGQYNDKKTINDLIALKYELEMRYLKRICRSPFPFYCYVDKGKFGQTLNPTAYFADERDAILFCKVKEQDQEGITCFYRSDFEGLKGLEQLMGEVKSHYKAI